MFFSIEESEHSPFFKAVFIAFKILLLDCKFVNEKCAVYEEPLSRKITLRRLVDRDDFFGSEGFRNLYLTLEKSQSEQFFVKVVGNIFSVIDRN